MIPTGKEAEFFSFYEISDRGTSAIGPFLFALMNEAFGSYRPAILGLILFFIAGIVALSFLDERRAIQSVRESESSSN